MVRKAFQCPCCGQSVMERIDPYRLVDHLKVGGIPRAIARILAANFARNVPTSLIVDCVYAGVKDGGPMDAAGVIKSSVHQLRKELVAYSLTVTGSRHKNAGSYRLDWIDAPAIARAP